LSNKAADFYQNLRETCGIYSLARVLPESWSGSMERKAWNEWLSSGNAGIFSYLDDRADLLCEPFLQRPWARCLIVYSFLPMPDLERRLYQLPAARFGHATGWIAGYAMGKDYHRVGLEIQEKLKAALQDFVGRELHFEGGVDAFPVFEKRAAVSAGLGSYGLNTLFMDKVYGCQLHLGSVFVDADLPDCKDDAIKKTERDARCEACRRCVHGCPGGALHENGIIEVQNCLSWLASEKHGALTWKEQQHLKNKIFGCSFCSTACPNTIGVIPEDYSIDAEELLLMPGRMLGRMIHGTALQHTGVSRIKRNCAAVLGTFLSAEERANWQKKYLSEIGSEQVRETIRNWVV